MAVQVTIQWGHLSPNPARPTIWEALAVKLGREPTNAEATAEVKRLLMEAADERLVDQAAEGATALATPGLA